MRFAKHILLCSLFALACCAPRPNNVIVLNSPAATPPGPRVVNRMLVSGKPTTVDRWFSLSQDCTPLDYTIRIVQAPAHGTAVIKDIQDFPNYPTTNARSACNGTKTQGHAAEYTSAANYTGSDYLTVNIFTDQGQYVEEKILITVK